LKKCILKKSVKKLNPNINKIKEINQKTPPAVKKTVSLFTQYGSMMNKGKKF
jgi:hypothetical protein